MQRTAVGRTRVALARVADAAKEARMARRTSGFVVALVGFVACATRTTPRVSVGELSAGLDPFLAAHPRGDKPIRADEVARTAVASYHLVQAGGSESPHRHATHDLTVVVLRGRGRLVRDTETIPMAAGDAALVPRQVVHWFSPAPGDDAVALIVFTPPLDAPDVVPAGPR
jgi:quercetin dioxygenase-like cupin family protein